MSSKLSFIGFTFLLYDQLLKFFFPSHYVVIIVVALLVMCCYLPSHLLYTVANNLKIILESNFTFILSTKF